MAVAVTVIFTVTKTATGNETVTYFQQYFSGNLSFSFSLLLGNLFRITFLIYLYYFLLHNVSSRKTVNFISPCVNKVD